MGPFLQEAATYFDDKRIFHLTSNLSKKTAFKFIIIIIIIIIGLVNLFADMTYERGLSQFYYRPLAILGPKAKKCVVGFFVLGFGGISRLWVSFSLRVC
ncbi:hypothetical protein [Coxiella-like endosymbiont]|uniref:hypothetical protein n=1 Tax=Coxiella-like endosymbiont TaxID=1592897 RepID=UPI00272A71B1|nr:hypothetical protein [Coxiella-like endosymbiont]